MSQASPAPPYTTSPVPHSPSAFTKSPSHGLNEAAAVTLSASPGTQPYVFLRPARAKPFLVTFMSPPCESTKERNVSNEVFCSVHTVFIK